MLKIPEDIEPPYSHLGYSVDEIGTKNKEIDEIMLYEH